MSSILWCSSGRLWLQERQTSTITIREKLWENDTYKRWSDVKSAEGTKRQKNKFLSLKINYDDFSFSCSSFFSNLKKISYRMAICWVSPYPAEGLPMNLLWVFKILFSPIESLQLYISMSIVDSSCWCEYLKSFFMFSPPWMEMNLELIRLQAERVMIQKKMWSLCITTCDFNSRGIWARGWAPDECGLYWKIIQFSNSMKTLSLSLLLIHLPTPGNP